MSLEDQLSRDLGRDAALAAARIDPVALARLGEREQRRRRTAVVAGVSVLTAALVAGVFWLPSVGADRARPIPPATETPTQTAESTPVAKASAAPATMEDLPVGPSTTVPWWADGVLHVGDAEIETPMHDLHFAGQTTLVGRQAATSSIWSRVVGDGLEPVVERPGYLRPLLSPFGGLMAWVSADGPTRRVLEVLDLTSGELLGTHDLSVDPECCDMSNDVFGLSLDDSGRLLYAVGDETFAWRPGAAPVSVDVDARKLYDGAGWPGGLMRLGPAGPQTDNVGIYGTVDESGRFTEVGRVPTLYLGSWNAQGDAFVFLANAAAEANVVQPGFLWVQSIDGSKPRRLALPDAAEGNRWYPVAWEDSTHVLVETGEFTNSRDPEDSDFSYILARCDIESLACERAGSQGLAHAFLPG